MKNRLRFFSISLGLLLSGASFAIPSAAADHASERLVATTQDETRKLSEDNIAYFTRADRRVRFQLVKLSGAASNTLLGTKVTVVDPTGTPSTITADAQGVATLENPVSGLYALSATDDRGHVAMPIAVREGQPAAAAADEATAPVKLAMMDVNPKEVLRFTSSYLDPEVGGSGMSAIDNDYVANGEPMEGLQYRVRLGDDGTLTGQVFSLAQNGLTTFGVGGTTIAIFKGNQLFARTVADDGGQFMIGGVKPGVYGLFAGGPGGYAGFGFEAYNAEAVASQNLEGETFVSTRSGDTNLVAKALAPGSVLPVVLIPPSMLPPVLASVRNAAGGFPGSGSPGIGGAPGIGPGGAGAGPGGVAGGAGGGFGGGFGGAAGGAGVGGLGGLLAAGGLAAVGIAAANNNDNNQEIASP